MCAFNEAPGMLSFYGAQHNLWIVSVTRHWTLWLSFTDIVAVSLYYEIVYIF